MTRDKYVQTHTPYVGKHEPQDYKVWVVAGPAGPAYEFIVHGMDEVDKAIEGAYDWDVVRLSDGKTIK